MLASPIIAADLAMRVITILDILKTMPSSGTRTAWLLFVGLVGIFGWLSYYIFGRKVE